MRNGMPCCIIQSGYMDTAQAELPVFHRLSALGDLNRARLLSLLAKHEYTVSELCAILQLPQSTVSRHLKVLADDGWVFSRADGTSRFYRMAPSLEASARSLWRIVREQVADSEALKEDAERARSVLARRREKDQEFFASAAGKWDGLRSELFGGSIDALPLYGLLEDSWTVGDLGAGTGHFAATVAPFVRKVIAVDRSDEMLAAARKRLEGLANVDLRQGRLEGLPVGDAELDLAVMLLVLHYVADPSQAMAEAARVLASGGRLILVDMRAHGRTEYIEEMGHRWQGFSREQVEAWTRDAGFERVQYDPLPADPRARGPLLFALSARKR